MIYQKPASTEVVLHWHHALRDSAKISYQMTTDCSRELESGGLPCGPGHVNSTPCLPVGLVAVNAMLLVAGREAKSTHSGFIGTTVRTGSGYGVAHAPVRQPARVAAVQPQEPPGGVKLAHLGDLAARIQTSLHGVCEVHCQGLLQEVDSAWQEKERPHRLSYNIELKSDSVNLYTFSIHSYCNYLLPLREAVKQKASKRSRC